MKKRLSKVVLCKSRWTGESTSDPNLFSRYFYPDLSKKGTIVESSVFSSVYSYLRYVIERSPLFRKDYKPLVIHSSDDLVIVNQCIAFYKDEYSRDHDDSDCCSTYCLVKFYAVC